MVGITSYYTTFRAKLIAIACHFGYTKEEGEDVVQQFFLEFMQKDIVEDIHNPEAFIVTSFKRKLIDLYRSDKRKNTHYVSGLLEIPSTQEIIERLESDEELVNKLAAAYKTLPARCRRVIYMKYYHGYTTSQIVDLTGLSEQNVYNNLSKGIQYLRKALGKQANRERFGYLFLTFF